MTIKSTAFGCVKLSEDDAENFRRQVSYGRPTKAALLSMKRGLEMSQALQDGGGKLKMTFSQAPSRRQKGESADPDLTGITDPALLEALKRAIAHKMTPAEKHAQRRSWIIGEMGIEHPELSREQLEALADHAVGPAPAAETPPPEAPTSRVGEG